MGNDILPKAEPGSAAGPEENPSEHVRLEADLIARQDSYNRANSSLHKNKTILIYCHSHEQLTEISSELISRLGSDVEVLSTTEGVIVNRLLKSGGIDLFLHGPDPDGLLAIYETLNEQPDAFIGSSMIMLRNHNLELEQWMNNPKHSIHLTKAITKLNAT